MCVAEIKTQCWGSHLDETPFNPVGSEWQRERTPSDDLSHEQRCGDKALCTDKCPACLTLAMPVAQRNSCFDTHVGSDLSNAKLSRNESYFIIYSGFEMKKSLMFCYCYQHNWNPGQMFALKNNCCGLHNDTDKCCRWWEGVSLSFATVYNLKVLKRDRREH